MRKQEPWYRGLKEAAMALMGIVGFGFGWLWRQEPDQKLVGPVALVCAVVLVALLLHSWYKERGTR